MTISNEKLGRINVEELRIVLSDFQEQLQTRADIDTRNKKLSEESLKNIVCDGSDWHDTYQLTHDAVINLMSKLYQFEDKDFDSYEEFETFMDNQEPNIATLSMLNNTINKQVDCLRLFGQRLNVLISLAQSDDDKFMKAIRLDKSLITYPPLAQRIIIAEQTTDEVFFSRLSRALTGKTTKFDQHSQLQFLLAYMYEDFTVDTLSEASAYDLFCVQLKVYPDTAGAPKSLFRYIQRWKKKRYDMKI